MEFVRNTLGIVALALSVVYAAWPLIVAAPLTGYSRRRNLLRGMVILWGFALVSFLATLAIGERPISFLIPEPLNTYLFFGTGLFIVGTYLATTFVRRRALVMTADGARSPEDLLHISPVQFEEMVVEFYRSRGAKAWRTGQTVDHGVDVVVETPRGEKWVVQCKRWRGWVGEPVVRDFYGVVQHEKAHKGVLVTTGTFSNAARVWATGKPLTLADGEEFMRAWRKARKSLSPSTRYWDASGPNLLS